MQCTICGGPLETTGGGAFGRCQRCGNIFSTSGGSPTPIVVVAPGESSEEAHARVFSGQRQVQQQPDNPMARMIRRLVIGLVLSILVIVVVVVVNTIRSATSTPNRRPTRGGR